MTFQCATVRYLTDPVRDISVPVGVVLWNPETGWWRLRLPEEDERIDGVQPSVANAYLAAARAELERWLQRQEIPYARGPIKAWSEAWWEQVRRLMQFTIRVGLAQTVDCLDPEREVEALFEAMVQPRVPPRPPGTP